MNQTESRFDVLRRMAALNRFSQTHLAKDESVLEHTGFVCVFTLLACQDLVNSGEDISISLAMSKAAAHDLDEIITGDIPRPTKYYNRKIEIAIDEIASINMHTVVRSLSKSSREDLYGFWYNAKLGKEGFVVKIADMAAVVYKAWQEAELYGNKTIVGHMSMIPNLLKRAGFEAQSIFDNPESMTATINQLRALADRIGEIK